MIYWNSGRYIEDIDDIRGHHLASLPALFKAIPFVGSTGTVVHGTTNRGHLPGLHWFAMKQSASTPKRLPGAKGSERGAEACLLPSRRAARLRRTERRPRAQEPRLGYPCGGAVTHPVIHHILFPLLFTLFWGISFPICFPWS